MTAGEVCRRREGETAEENETTRLKQRKLEEEAESRMILSPCVQGTHGGGIVAVASETSVVEEECQIPSLECDLFDSASSSSVSCCSSNNRSEEESKRRIDDGGEFDQRETSSWIYGNLNKRRDTEQEESVNEEVESRGRKKKKRSCETVKEAELEGFFQAVEKDLRDKMLESSMKYSFDFEKDEPLGGRYEWVKLNP